MKGERYLSQGSRTSTATFQAGCAQFADAQRASLRTSKHTRRAISKGGDLDSRDLESRGDALVHKGVSESSK